MKKVGRLFAVITERIAGNQKLLLWYFLAVLMFTNTVLLFTERMSFLSMVAFITVPVGVQLLFLALSKRPGKAFLWMFIKCVLDAFQMVLIVMYGGSIIGVDMFLNVTTTSVREATELLSSLMPTMALLIIIYIPALYFSIRSLKKMELSGTYRRGVKKLSGSIILVGVVFMVLASFSKKGYTIKYDLYPCNAVYNMGYAVKKMHEISQYPKYSYDFKYNSVHTPVYADSVKQREIAVLVLGETSRALNFGVYGYERNTTPHLDSIENLVVYSDVLTESNTTHKIVPMVLSPAQADNYEIIKEAKSIVTAYKEAGFKTAFLTNHVYNLGYANYYFDEADIKVNNRETSLLDGDMISHFSRIIDSTEENLFFVVHLYGSHFRYYDRYPREFAYFTPDESPDLSFKYKAENINAFDNSIYYTSYIVSEIIKHVQTKGAVSHVMYVSDHGEDLMDDSRKRLLHASPVPTFYQLYIPFMLWTSDAYNSLKGNKVANIVANKDVPISNSAVFHTMMDMSSISTEYLRKDYAVSSDEFVWHSREYLTDHYTSCKIKDLQLRKYDWEQFDKRGKSIE
jgi:glucan phosphoethanolaminetransferase (alkaline phosphatase superfamily)